jgi:hypothetical protein
MSGNDEPTGTLEEPRIPDAFDGKLDPWALGESITYLVPFYPGLMKVGDIISASVIGMPPFDKETWLDERTLTEADLHDPVAFACPARTLQPIDGGKALFNYTVRRDGTIEHRSLALILDILRGAQLGPRAPWVEGTVGNLGSELRMDGQNGLPVRVRVERHTGKHGDAVLLQWKPAEDEAFSPRPQNITEDEEILSFEVPYEIANKSPGRVLVDYGLIRAGDPVVPSAPRILDVIASLVPPQLPAPVILEADTQGRLDPLTATLTVRAPITASLADLYDELVLGWTGLTPDGSYSAKVAPPVADMVIDVPTHVLAFNAGQSVQVAYTLIKGADENASPDSTVEVRPIPDDSAALPRPTFSVASDSELDMGLVEGDADIIIDRYRLAADGQRYWLTLTGKLADGSDRDIPIAAGATITGSERPILSLGKAAHTALIQFKDGTPIMLDLRVTFDQSNDIDHAVRFRTTTLTIRQAGSTRYPPPILKGIPPESTIDPLAVEVLTGVLPSDVEFFDDDTVDITWTEHSGDGTRTFRVAEPKQNREINIPLPLLGYALYETISLSYVIHRTSGDVHSEITTYRIGGVPSFSELLPMPTVTEAPEGIIDVPALDGDAHVTLPTFPLYFEGQRHWTSVIGGPELARGEELVGTGPHLPLGTISKQWLAEQEHGSDFIGLTLITLDGSNDPDHGAGILLRPFRFVVHTQTRR